MDIDSIPDAWEINHFGNITTIDETSDYDGDGLLDTDEYTYSTNPTDPDSNNDGISDGDEVNSGTDPLQPNS